MLAVHLKLRRGDFALDVAFEAPTPGVIALFGRSGCGKTTVVLAIAGLLTPDDGRIALDDRVFFAAGRTNEAAERRRIGCVFQDARLFPHFSALGNLRYGAKRAPRDAHRIELDEVIDLLGLRALLSRRPHQLSGGERHRVAIGRALLSQPRLLLLDEPLASQDLARRAELLPYLERLCRSLRIPIVYVSHQFDEVVRLATHVVVLDDGAVAAQGGVAALSRSPALREILGPEGVGTVVEGELLSNDPSTGLARVRVGAGSLSVPLEGASPGQRVRLHLLARDVLLALDPPTAAVAADVLSGTIASLTRESSQSQLAEVDVGGALLLARVPSSGAAAFAPGRRVSLLVDGAWSRAYALSDASRGGESAGAAAQSSATLRADAPPRAR
ncbi:MAG: molybdenum ABC transporter ATP-binding protein [Myxococcota bacterium]